MGRMMSERTPGPWLVKTYMPDDIQIITPDQAVIADLIARRNNKPNAALIAAAPDLLKALEAIMAIDWIEVEAGLGGWPGMDWPETLTAADAAIVRARGNG